MSLAEVRTVVLDEIEEWYSAEKNTKTVVCVGLAVAEIFRENYPLSERDWLTEENQVKTSGDGSRDAIAKELGDVLWYVAAICDELGLEMSDVARRNVEKLSDRQERGVIQGEGDER